MALEELRYLVLAVQREGNRQLAAALTPADLTPAQAEVLRVLEDAAADAEPLSLVGVGQRLVCETGSPSRLVQALVTRGLVARRPAPYDARAVVLTLTAAGRRAAAAVRAAEDALYAGIATRVSGGDVAVVQGVLRRLLADTRAGAAVAARHLGAPADRR